LLKSGGDVAAAKVFVSYSHQDKKYLKENSLLGFLRGLEREGLAEFWWDARIAVGEKWDEEIKNRIRESSVALLLISQAFLSSSYCVNTEIPEFLKKAEEGGLAIFPVMLSQRMGKACLAAGATGHPVRG
jgi:hypothetical protein